jgi:hypothetical protein
MKFLFDDESFHSRRCGPRGLRCAAGPIWARSWSLRTGSPAGMRQAGTGRRRPPRSGCTPPATRPGLAGTGQRPGDPVARVGLRGRLLRRPDPQGQGLHPRRHRGPDHRSHPDHGPGKTTSSSRACRTVRAWPRWPGWRQQAPGSPWWTVTSATPSGHCCTRWVDSAPPLPGLGSEQP